VAKRDNGGFVAGLLVGGLVGAALALLSTPRSGRENREALLERVGGLPAQTPEALLERGRQVVRTRFREAADEAQQAADETAARLEREYRSAQGS
jgi:gas vesicle protein